MRIYLAGPMSGLPEFNFPAFDAGAKVLADQGHEVFNPAENDRQKWGSMENIKKNANYRECLSDDLNWILHGNGNGPAEAIALLPGWEKSKGAAAELALARALGLFIIFMPGAYVNV